MSLSRRQFTKEFKLAAVRRLGMGASIVEVARAFEASPRILAGRELGDWEPGSASIGPSVGWYGLSPLQREQLFDSIQESVDANSRQRSRTET